MYIKNQISFISENVRIPIYVGDTHNPMNRDLHLMYEFEWVENGEVNKICFICSEDDELQQVFESKDDLTKWLNERSFIFELVPEEQYRICSACKKVMQEGYVFETPGTYYCSDECRSTVVTEQEYLERYDDGEGDAYWTEWHNC